MHAPRKHADARLGFQANRGDRWRSCDWQVARDTRLPARGSALDRAQVTAISFLPPGWTPGDLHSRLALLFPRYRWLGLISMPCFTAPFHMHASSLLVCAHPSRQFPRVLGRPHHCSPASSWWCAGRGFWRGAWPEAQQEFGRPAGHRGASWPSGVCAGFKCESSLHQCLVASVSRAVVLVSVASTGC